MINVPGAAKRHGRGVRPFARSAASVQLMFRVFVLIPTVCCFSGGVGSSYAVRRSCAKGRSAAKRTDARGVPQAPDVQKDLAFYDDADQ